MVDNVNVKFLRGPINLLGYPPIEAGPSNRFDQFCASTGKNGYPRVAIIHCASKIANSNGLTENSQNG